MQGIVWQVSHKTRSQGKEARLLCTENRTDIDTLVWPKMVNNIAYEDVRNLQIGALGVRAIIVACNMDVSKWTVAMRINLRFRTCTRYSVSCRNDMHFRRWVLEPEKSTRKCRDQVQLVVHSSEV